MSATSLILNILFGVIGVLVAVGIPTAGMFWQRDEEWGRGRSAARPTRLQRRHPASL